MPLRKNLNQNRFLYTRSQKRKKRKFSVFLILLILAGTGFLVVKMINNKKENKGENVVAKTIEKIKPVPKPDNTLTEIETYLASQDGEYGYWVTEIDSGKEFGNRGDQIYVAASTVKVGIASYVYSQIEAGNISPDKYLTYTSADYEGGTGSLQGSAIGSKFKVSYLLDRMIKVSDNVATNILIRTYGRSNIQNYLNSKGLGEVNMLKNQVTPRVMSKMLYMLESGELIEETNKEELILFMKSSILPTRLVAGVPETIDVAHKIGTQTQAISDIGIVYLSEKPYAIAIYSKLITNVEVAESVIKNISQKIYKYETTR